VRLTLPVIRQIAQQVASSRDPQLRVTSAAVTEGGSAYVEVTLTLEGRSTEPSLLIIGVDRTAPESAVRTAIDDHVQAHIDQHAAVR
jgi:hypothetical protein